MQALAIMPQASGIALGFDRLVMLATGASHIEQVIWTPVQQGTIARMRNSSGTLRSAADLVAAGLFPEPKRTIDRAIAAIYAIARDRRGRGADRCRRSHDPIARQFIPDVAELAVAAGRKGRSDRRSCVQSGRRGCPPLPRPRSPEIAAHLSGLLPVLLPPRGRRTKQPGASSRQGARRPPSAISRTIRESGK